MCARKRPAGLDTSSQTPNFPEMGEIIKPTRRDQQGAEKKITPCFREREREPPPPLLIIPFSSRARAYAAAEDNQRPTKCVGTLHAILYAAVENNL